MAHTILIMSDRAPMENDITGLLQAVRRGESGALDELFPLVYEELRSLARRQRGRWHRNVTLNATALVHEAYIKLVDPGGVAPKSREHFFAVAAKAMRHILCNYARDRARLKRGGGVEHVPIDREMRILPAGASGDRGVELLALDEALERLERVSERQSRIVECRFFGGMSVEETASALGLSPATVKRDWTLARAWLYREIGGSDPSRPTSEDTPSNL